MGATGHVCQDGGGPIGRLPKCHCGHRLLLVTDDFSPIAPSFRGLCCVDCQVVSDPDCEPGEGEANHLRCLDPVAQGLSHRDCPICGADSGEPHNWDVHNAEARA